MWRGCPGQGGEKIMIYFSAADGTFNWFWLAVITLFA
jgi:hypothetical protein